MLYAKHESSMDNVVGFVDLDYIGCLDTRRSLTGYMFKFYGNTVSWKCNLQHVVSLSTTEAEFIALTEAIKEVVCMKGMATNLHTKVKVLRCIVTAKVAFTWPRTKRTMRG